MTQQTSNQNKQVSVATVGTHGYTKRASATAEVGHPRPFHAMEALYQLLDGPFDQGMPYSAMKGFVVV